MTHEEINIKAIELAYAAYSHARKIGCEEGVALALMNNAHNHWLFVLEQQEKSALRVLGGIPRVD